MTEGLHVAAMHERKDFSDFAPRRADEFLVYPVLQGLPGHPPQWVRTWREVPMDFQVHPMMGYNSKEISEIFDLASAWAKEIGWHVLVMWDRNMYYGGVVPHLKKGGSS